jgi:hypothetical protein
VKRGYLTAIFFTVACAFGICATPAFAYLGPGAGLSAIGALVALIIGVILAFVGFIWYPVKRLLWKGKATSVSASEPRQKLHADSIE